MSPKYISSATPLRPPIHWLQFNHSGPGNFPSFPPCYNNILPSIPYTHHTITGGPIPSQKFRGVYCTPHEHRLGSLLWSTYRSMVYLTHYDMTRPLAAVASTGQEDKTIAFVH